MVRVALDLATQAHDYSYKTAGRMTQLVICCVQMLTQQEHELVDLDALNWIKKTHILLGYSKQER